ncbi:hypothetical protein KDN32_11375 [Nocardioides sp. J2M5]|uniref:hypothetical protein n=1 Tax=Nocardioides palaemonis TaxID=2829810 RepID=UPI001BACD927|nr:hypothetical protein [Nocardioides palaemonis]MBS2938343.1 hypothetical protein [Nocardioides palaemonis]
MNRTLSAYALLLLAGVLVLATVALAWGHRDQAAPQPAHFAEATVAPGGVRLLGLGHDQRSRSSWWWRDCDGGSYDHSAEQSGDTLRVDLTYVPSPHLGSCPVEESWRAGGGGRDGSILIPLDGPPPTTVVVEGDTTPHPVVEPDLEPVFPAGTAWEETGDFYRPAPAGDGETTRSWTATSGRARVDLTYVTGYVGQAPDAWVRTGDLAPAVPARRVRTADVEDDLRLGGVPVVARLAWVRGQAEVDVMTPDDRVVLRMVAFSMGTAEVVHLLRSFAAANP